MREALPCRKAQMKILSADEDLVMQATFKAAFLRAADIVDKITADDVLAMQAALLADGATLEQVARIDRATLAVAHLRACAQGEFSADKGVESLRRGTQTPKPASRHR